MSKNLFTVAESGQVDKFTVKLKRCSGNNRMFMQIALMEKHELL